MAADEFVAGAWCLDFANTVEPRSTLEHDYLPNYDRLAVWSRKAGAVTARTAGALQELATEHPREADRAHAEAMTLREAIYRIFAAISGDESPDAADLAYLRDCEADAIAHAAPEWTTSGLQWEWQQAVTATPDVSRLHVPRWILADDAARLLQSPRIDRVKICRPSCAWLFLDTTRNGSRRWCTVDDCGVREKIRRQAERRAARRLRS
jgi:predicted RNA-binding Zn ribbon-like protein